MVAYTLTRPCSDCPFRRHGGIKLRAARIAQLDAAAAPRDGQGAEFHCHKTTRAGGAAGDALKQCAGALIYCEKQRRLTQMMRIAERLGLYDHNRLGSPDLVWDDVDEWLDGGSDD